MRKLVAKCIFSFRWLGILGNKEVMRLADVLFGKVNPSAKLTITFPKSLEQYPKDFHSRGDRNEYKEGLYVGYRYFDKFKKETLFPFRPRFKLYQILNTLN